MSLILFMMHLSIILRQWLTIMIGLVLFTSTSYLAVLLKTVSRASLSSLGLVYAHVITQLPINKSFVWVLSLGQKFWDWNNRVLMLCCHQSLQLLFQSLLSQKSCPNIVLDCISKQLLNRLMCSFHHKGSIGSAIWFSLLSNPFEWWVHHLLAGL